MKRIKTVHYSLKNPRPTGQCDYSGFLCMHHDLVPQYEYSGSGLYNTGFLVYKKFADKPNPALQTPTNVGGDPKPVINARPYKYKFGD